MARIAKVYVTKVDRDEAYEAHKLAFPDDKWCGDECTYWLAKRAGKVVGFLAAYCDERGVFISRVAVVVAEQGTGLGRRLVRLAIRWGYNCGYAHAYTYTLLKNYPSMSMLLRCGFRFVEPPKSGQYHGTGVHYFARQIRAGGR